MDFSVCKQWPAATRSAAAAAAAHVTRLSDDAAADKDVIIVCVVDADADAGPSTICIHLTFRLHCSPSDVAGKPTAGRTT